MDFSNLEIIFSASEDHPVSSKILAKYNKLIARFGTPTKYNLKQYPEADVKLCDVIVKVGNDVDYGILTTTFYRNYEPDRIFLFDFAFDTNAKGLINSPQNK